MFFNKKYHTFKMSNKKYKSLKSNFVFTFTEVENIFKSIDFLSDNENWEFNFAFDIKDKDLKPSVALELYHRIGIFLEITFIPESIETIEEFLEYIKEKEMS
jgi:hypothetical protein